MTQRTIEPYRDETLPERFLRWIETIRARFKTIPNYTEFTGSPEGVIFGTKADRYYDLTADEVYVKTTTSGNTGWVLITTGGQDATFQGLGQWRYRTTTAGTPGAGQLEFDNLDINLATEFYLNVTNDNGVDMTAFLGLISADDLVYIQVSNNSAQYVVTQVGLPVLAAGVYTFPIQLAEGVGGAPTNNTPVSIVTAAPAGGGSGTNVDPGAVDGDMLYWVNGTLTWTPSSSITWDAANATLQVGANDRVEIDGNADAGSGGQVRVTKGATAGVAAAAFFIPTLTGDKFILGALSSDDADEFGIAWNLALSDPNETVVFHWATFTGNPLEFRRGDSSVHLVNSQAIVQEGSFFGAYAAGALPDRLGYGQFWSRDDDTPMWTDELGNDIALNGGGGGVTSFELRTGAVVAVTTDYDAFYLVKTGGAQTCTSDVTINGGGSLTIDDAVTNFRLRNSTDLLMYSAGNTENFRISQSASLVQFTGSGFAPPDHTLQIQNFVGLDINVQTYFQPPLAVGGSSNPGSGASWNAPQGTAPTTPLNGDWWQTTLGAFSRINGRTQLMDPSRSELNVQDGNYTLLLSDQGKTIAKRAGGAGETYTIPANASVAYEIGAWVAFDNDGGGDLTIAITTDTLVGTDGVTGSRTLGDNQRAMAQKINTTRWRYQATDL